MSEITIFHNPHCGTSRNTLALIRHAGFEPRVVEYLNTPLSRAELAQLAAVIDGGARSLLRGKEALAEQLNLNDPATSDATLLDALGAHPQLFNRPVVVSPLGVAACRPSEVVLELLPVGPLPPFTKEDGETVVDSGKRRGA